MSKWSKRVESCELRVEGRTLSRTLPLEGEGRVGGNSQLSTINFQLGFTLLEVMIALAIVAITLVTVGSLRNRDVLYHGDVRQIIMATLLAQERMTAFEMEGEFPEVGEISGDFEDPYHQFRWVQAVASTPFEFAREVRLSVYWGSGRPEESVEVISYVLEEK